MLILSSSFPLFLSDGISSCSQLAGILFSLCSCISLCCVSFLLFINVSSILRLSCLFDTFNLLVFHSSLEFHLKGLLYFCLSGP